MPRSISSTGRPHATSPTRETTALAQNEPTGPTQSGPGRTGVAGAAPAPPPWYEASARAQKSERLQRTRAPTSRDRPKAAAPRPRTVGSRVLAGSGEPPRPDGPEMGAGPVAGAERSPRAVPARLILTLSHTQRYAGLGDGVNFPKQFRSRVGRRSIVPRLAGSRSQGAADSGLCAGTPRTSHGRRRRPRWEDGSLGWQGPRARVARSAPSWGECSCWGWDPG